MSENVIDKVAPEVAPPVRPPEAAKKKKPNPKRKKRIKRIVWSVIGLAALAGVGFLIFKLFFAKEAVTYPTAVAYYGSIESRIYGSGSTRARQSADITPAAKGTVREVYVSVGQQVMAGDPLFSIEADSLNEDLDEAVTALEALLEQRALIEKNLSGLALYAPFKGKVLDTAVHEGDTIGQGQRVATYIDDAKMRLVLYFSYAYQNEIKTGMQARVSIPATMASIGANVERVDMIKKITPEGAMLFEVTLIMDNPGTLTRGMVATAGITAPDGEVMYPAENGGLEYNKEIALTSESAGKITALNLRDYYEFNQGALLMSLENEQYQAQLEALGKQIEDANAQINAINDQFASLEKTAPIDGTVTSCMIAAGQVVDVGYTVMTVSNLSNMVIEAQVNEIDISKVKVGMNIMINQDTYEGSKQYTGTVESISLQGKNDYGVSYFPVIVAVDNYDNSIMPGMSIWFQITAMQKDWCLIVPPQAVQNMPDGATCVFVKAESAPENALDVSQWPDIVPEGFFAVPVSVGISNETGVEIIDGIMEGAEVYSESAGGNQPYYPDGGGILKG